MPSYHFYLLRADGGVGGAADCDLADDHAALTYARALLPGCHTVEVLRGALVLGEVAARRDETPLPPQRRWWSLARARPAFVGSAANDEAAQD